MQQLIDMDNLTMATRLAMECLSEFDFEKVHKVMTFLDWKWWFPGQPHVPDIEELKRSAEKLLAEVVTDNKGSTYISSGGLKAEKTSHEGRIVSVYLTFELANWVAEAYE
jgi:hypothetical protein